MLLTSNLQVKASGEFKTMSKQDTKKLAEVREIKTVDNLATADALKDYKALYKANNVRLADNDNRLRPDVSKLYVDIYNTYTTNLDVSENEQILNLLQLLPTIRHQYADVRLAHIEKYGVDFSDNQNSSTWETVSTLYNNSFDTTFRKGLSMSMLSKFQPFIDAIHNAIERKNPKDNLEKVSIVKATVSANYSKRSLDNLGKLVPMALKQYAKAPAKREKGGTKTTKDDSFNFEVLQRQVNFMFTRWVEVYKANPVEYPKLIGQFDSLVKQFNEKKAEIKLAPATPAQQVA